MKIGTNILISTPVENNGKSSDKCMQAAVIIKSEFSSLKKLISRNFQWNNEIKNLFGYYIEM
mgnify:CR=1 FL=1